MNQEVARMGEKLHRLIEQTAFDAYREGYMVGSVIVEAQTDYELRVARAEGNANAYFDVRRERFEKAVEPYAHLLSRCAELEKALREIEARWTKARRHHNCDDYERGYGQAEADIGQFARAALGGQS